MIGGSGETNISGDANKFSCTLAPEKLDGWVRWLCVSGTNSVWSGKSRERERETERQREREREGERQRGRERQREHKHTQTHILSHAYCGQV